MGCEIDDCAVCDNGFECDNCCDTVEIRDASTPHDEPVLCDECAQDIAATLPEIRAELEAAHVTAQIERARTDAAQAEVARRGDVMLAALRELDRGDYNAAAVLLASVVRAPLADGRALP